ncbi:MAG: crossover junction endodeoxyribonuclease RuvC [Planctomycetota bacterium]
MRVLGIDPGTRITGYGCIDAPAEIGARPVLVEAGVVRLVKGGDPAPELPSRLSELERDTSELIQRVQPDVIGIEAMFTNLKHPGTIITMAHARGVIMLAAHRSGAELVELPPASVKKALASSGGADKSQIQESVRLALGLTKAPKPRDVADALAIAITATRRSAMARLTGPRR